MEPFGENRKCFLNTSIGLSEHLEAVTASADIGKVLDVTGEHLGVQVWEVEFVTAHPWWPADHSC